MLSRPIALSGFMGAGKSTVGSRLARSRSLPFVDLDAELEAAFAHPISDIFRVFGEPAFRAMEERLLAQALSLPGRVLALGGGAVLSEASRKLLRERAVWVHLDVPLHELERRVAGRPGRPLWDADVAARFEARRPIYAQASHRVDGDARPGEVVAAIERILDGTDGSWAQQPAARPAERLPVAVPGAEYEVVLGARMDGVAEAIGAIGRGPIALLSDWNVAPLHADALGAALRGTGRRVVRQTLPAGESNKTIRHVVDCVGRLLDDGWQRGAPVVALGGGLLGDMAGLVAAMLLRGVPFVQVPTSLLAMVDASVGGKVGVNHRRHKNLIGSFYQPALVWSDLAYLDTLPDRELRAGLAEVVKTALLGDRELFERLEAEPARFLARDPAVIGDAVARCVRFKASIVARDAREHGVRAWLNLGHTVGHALEAVALPGQIKHGEAVAIGLVAAAEIGVREGITEPGLPDRIRGVLTSLGLPIRAPALARHGIRKAISGDKKLKDDAVLWILMRTIDQPCSALSPLTDLDSRIDTLVDAGVLTESGES